MAVKTCTKCGIEKPLDDFGNCASKKNGKYSQCKTCMNKHKCEYRKTYKGRAVFRKAQNKYRSTICGNSRKRYRDLQRRCTDPNNKDYVRYGNRGIKCEFISAKDFADYVEEIGVDPVGKDVHRIDNDGNYCRGNIEFLTPPEHRLKHREMSCTKGAF